MKKFTSNLILLFFALMVIGACSKSATDDLSGTTSTPTTNPTSVPAPAPAPAPVDETPVVNDRTHDDGVMKSQIVKKPWHDVNDCTHCHIKHNHNEHACAGPCQAKK